MSDAFDFIKERGLDVCPGCKNRIGNKIDPASDVPGRSNLRMVCAKCGRDWVVPGEPPGKRSANDELQYLRENALDTCPECENPNRKDNVIAMAKSRGHETSITCADCGLSWSPDVPEP